MQAQNKRPISDATEGFCDLPHEAAFLKVDSRPGGLTSIEGDRRVVEFGPNSLESSSRNSSLFLFLHQFKTPITLLLIGAALLSFALQDRTDALIILAIVLISSLLGWWQEKGAADAVAQLMKLVQIRAHVLRDGIEADLPIESVVPGDIVMLTAGDVIPGDSLLLESKELFVDEASFTGETFPVEKETGVLPADTPLAKQSNSLFMGSHVVSGKAKALVMKTAKMTEFGKITGRLQLRPPETDFEHGIRRFGYMLMEITLVLVVIIFAINVFLERPVLDSFLFSLALAVGLTPQLLPAIITVNLATGARRMAKHKVIVKRLSSIENFGSMNILCTDKTGTITEGKVELHSMIDPSGKESEKVRHFAWLNASLQQGFHNPIDDAIVGSVPDEVHEYVLKSEVPYDFVRRRLTVQVTNTEGGLAITKGAVNQVLEVCSQVELHNGTKVPLCELQAEIIEQYHELSSRSYRTLGVAYVPFPDNVDFQKDDEKEMIFLGFVILYDPLKPNVKDTIDDLNELGVRLKLITGDNALVAQSLTEQLGMRDAVILTGPELQKMSDQALLYQVSAADVFAEVDPMQKEQIIRSLQKGGNVVGFMGDGINDAAALHAADVGISVDSAVDVAKEAAVIVLLDHDLSVLLEGIKEGRRTFANTMKYVFMATSANFGNMFSMAGASLFLPFLPLLPKQILLTNLMTDFPETTISTDQVDAESIASPRRWDIGFIKRFMLTFGLLSSMFDFLTFGALLYILSADEQQFQTGWFMESVISASLIVLVIRTRMPFFTSIPGKYLSIATGLVFISVLILPLTPLASLFGFVPLPLEFYALMLVIVSLYIVSAEFTKRWFYRHYSN
jgi:Mg2+-importing ATPase